MCPLRVYHLVSEKFEIPLIYPIDLLDPLGIPSNVLDGYHLIACVVPFFCVKSKAVMLLEIP